MKKALYLLVAFALLAGCAGPKKPNALNLLVFEGYADKSWLDPFIKETGAVVNVTNATSVDEIFNKMAADGGKGIDLATIDTSLFKRYYEHKLISPINTSKLKNYKDVLPEFQNLKVTQFDGKQYGVPYAWGTIPLFWDESVIKEKPDSWASMWDPKYKGKVLLLDEPQNAYVTMALKLGGFKDLWNFDDQDFSRLAEGFKTIAPQLRTLTTGATDAVNLIANHEAVIGMAFGEQLKSQALPEGSESEPYHPQGRRHRLAGQLGHIGGDPERGPCVEVDRLVHPQGQRQADVRPHRLPRSLQPRGGHRLCEPLRVAAAPLRLSEAHREVERGEAPDEQEVAAR